LEFLNALRFLSIIPVPWDDEVGIEDLGKASAWFPLVGAVLGGLLLFVHGITGLIFQPAVCNAIVVVMWIVLTRGFHLDGLADTFDGLGGGATREARLAIMKDSRLGTFGVLAVICMLLLKFVVLDGLKWQFFSKTLILAPILGRWVMLIGIRFFPSARPGGLGDIFCRNCTNRELVIGTASAIVLAVLLSGLYGLFFMAVAGCAAYLAARLLFRALGGLTGDSYGTLCEIGEVTTLLAASFIMHLFMLGY
jgi:adenosylcobinamide-GDP ribazoletransferase